MGAAFGFALTAAMAAIGPASARVDVDPLSIEGELPQEWRESSNAAVLSGLARGAVEARMRCATAPCPEPTAEFVVTGSLSIVDRDWAVRLEVRRSGETEVVASTEGFCELCGVEEAIDEIEARAAVLVPRIEQLGASAPVLMFRSTPPGVELSVDSQPQGVTPIEVRTEAGKHLVEATKPGYLPQSVVVQAIDGVQQEISLRLVPIPAAPPPNGRGLRLAGVGSLLGSVVALAAGVPLLALHGRSYERTCNADATGRCQFDYDTQTGGIVGTAIGGALVVTGAVLLSVGIRRGRSAHAVAVSPGGISLRF
ncbi:MAG: PEGA domain-containing protein [Nannocystaceae bacterium]|nr:PEGA domain-containing protein [Nannocystaceae bacterium]